MGNGDEEMDDFDDDFDVDGEEEKKKPRPVAPRARPSDVRAKPRGRGRPRAPAQLEVNMRAYISRTEAARQLGRSTTSMRRYEDVWFRDTKLLRNGVTYYPRHQFEELRASLSDDASYVCYELFAQGLGPHAVVLRLKHQRPALVRQYYQDFLATVELDASKVVIELDPDMRSDDWRNALRLPPDLHPAWLRRAVEYCALSTEARYACDLAVQRYEEQRRRREAVR